MNAEGLKKCEVKLFKLNWNNVNSATAGRPRSSTATTTTAASDPHQHQKAPFVTLDDDDDLLKKEGREKQDPLQMHQQFNLQPIVLLPRMIFKGSSSSSFTRIPLSMISMDQNRISIQASENNNMDKIVNLRRSFRLAPPQIIKELHQVKRQKAEPDDDQVRKKVKCTVSNNNKGNGSTNENENDDNENSNKNNGAKKGKKSVKIVNDNENDNQFLDNCRGCFILFDDEEDLKDHEEVCVKIRLNETDLQVSTVENFCKYFNLTPKTPSTTMTIDNGPLAYDPNIEIPQRLRTNRVQLASYFRNNPVPISCFRGKSILFGDKAIGKINEPAERLIRDYELYCGTQVKRIKHPIICQTNWPVVKTRRVQKMLNNYSHKYSFTADERNIRSVELSLGLGSSSWHLLSRCKPMKIVAHKLPESKNEALMRKRSKLLEKLKKGKLISIYGKIPIVKLSQRSYKGLKCYS